MSKIEIIDDYLMILVKMKKKKIVKYSANFKHEIESYLQPKHKLLKGKQIGIEDGIILAKTLKFLLKLLIFILNIYRVI